MSSMSRLELRVAGETIAVEAPLPEASSSPDALLPFMRAVTDAVVEHAAARVVRLPSGESRSVSCARGCASCCHRQPVPVAPPEALALLRIVESQPEPRRRRLRERFRDRARRIEEAGLRPRLLQEVPSTREEAREIARRYLAVGLACPFLEDDVCSIYTERPLACRLYLVTSPPALCADPLEQPIVQVPVPMRPLAALLDALEEVGGGTPHTVPLALALDWAEAHRTELERRVDPGQLAAHWVARLGRQPAP